MALRIGDATPSRVYVDDRPLLRIYDGDALLWSAGVNDGDDFNRESLGADWITHGFTNAAVVPVLNGNRLRSTAAPATNSNYQSAGLFARTPAATDSFEVRATVATAVNTLLSGLIVAASADFQDFVLAVLSTTAGSTGIHTFSGGTGTRRTTSSTSSFAVGDVAALRIQGTTVSLIRNPDTTATVVSSWQDTGGVVARGAAHRLGGLFVNCSRAFAATTTYSAEWDDFGIRDL